MGVRHCDVGAVLNVKSDHLGLRGVGTLDDLAKVKRIVVEVARETAVLNADDPLCLKMADYTSAKHLCYVTMDPTHTLVGEHIKAGGRGVVLESGIKGQMITIYDHGAHIPLLWTHLIPATLEGRALHNVQNAMFAAAMAFSMGLKLEDIRHGLRTFDTTFFQAPGRMNIFDEHPFKVILDYGHNPAAVEAMCQLVERLEPAGRRICVLAAPGDRRDEDIADIGRIAAGQFDRYILRRDDSLRGRKPEEVPHLLRDALLAAEGAGRADPGDPGRADGDRHGAARGAAGRPAAAVRGRDHPELEAGDPVPARGAGPAGRAAAGVAAGAGVSVGAAGGRRAARVRARLARRVAGAGGGGLGGGGRAQRGRPVIPSAARDLLPRARAIPRLGPSLRSG